MLAILHTHRIVLGSSDTIIWNTNFHYIGICRYIRLPTTLTITRSIYIHMHIYWCIYVHGSVFVWSLFSYAASKRLSQRPWKSTVGIQPQTKKQQPQTIIIESSMKDWICFNMFQSRKWSLVLLGFWFVFWNATDVKCTIHLSSGRMHFRSFDLSLKSRGRLIYSDMKLVLMEPFYISIHYSTNDSWYPSVWCVMVFW